MARCSSAWASCRLHSVGEYRNVRDITGSKPSLGYEAIPWGPGASLCPDDPIVVVGSTEALTEAFEDSGGHVDPLSRRHCNNGPHGVLGLVRVALLDAHWFGWSRRPRNRSPVIPRAGFRYAFDRIGSASNPRRHESPNSRCNSLSVREARISDRAG
jgi:hypothetical protein